MKLQDRDKQILKELFRFGCLTTHQIAQLFELNIKIAQRRLRIIKNEDYVRKMSIPTKEGKSPYLFYPGKKAENIFQITSSKPRLTTQLTHQQKNTDILIKIKKSFKNTDIECNLLPEHIIRTAKQQLIPDGAVKLTRNNQSALFFVENCSGTETIKSPKYNEDIENKIIQYTTKFQDNQIDIYNQLLEYNFLRFKLLYITNSTRRLDSISEIIKKHDQHGFIYITTIKAFYKNNIFSPIWTIPATNNPSASIIREK